MLGTGVPRIDGASEQKRASVLKKRIMASLTNMCVKLLGEEYYGS
jgi:hypothetical protein